tara:strand:- start:10000 stop:11055 length:1056 start_codon:yes stop_codon:yes gene_type:complete
MTTFFDQKQDVLDVELTKYGEYLLSLGKFNPVYYSFFDNNVLYDSRYAGYSSSQNDLEPRIQEETPSTRTQYSFEGRGEQVLAYNASIADQPHLREDERIRFPSTADKHFTSLNAPLGQSDLSSTRAPAWSMRFYNGKVANSSTTYTGSHAPLKIPQIDATIKYNTKLMSTEIGNETVEVDGAVVQSSYNQPVESEPALSEGIFPDGSYVAVEGDYILLDLQEINSLYERENFDIEVYEIQTETLDSGDTRDNLIPMKFKKQTEQVVNNILVDQEVSSFTPTPNYVEYFFDIVVDDEIDDVIICKSLSQLKAEGVYIETEFKCPDLPTYTEAGSSYASESITPQCDDGEGG